jgi:hypothetical protein
MALGTTNITTTTVKTLFGVASSVWSVLCTLASVNKWSRYKPVRGVWPQDDSGYYGFNLGAANPNKWDYLQPNNNYRIGDFRGYEHNKANTDPPVYADNTSASGNFQPSVKDANVNPTQGSWRFGKNLTHDNIRILPADLNLASYYWGVKLVSPSASAYYKTLGNLNDDAVFTFDMKFDNPGSAIFVNFPQNWTSGSWSWQLFISSTQASTWTSTAPSNLIYLPTDTGIARLISAGTFTMLHYVVFGIGSYTAILALPSAGGNFAYTAGSMTSGYDYGKVNTNSGGVFTVDIGGNSWIHYAVYDSTNSTRLTDPSSWIDGCCLRVWCDLNNGNSRSPDIYLNASDASYNFTVNQAGHPPSFNHNPAWAPGWSAGPTATAAYSDTQIYITGTPNGFYNGSGTKTMYIWVKKAGVLVGNVLSFGAKDGSAYTQWITGLPGMDSSTYNIYYDSVDRSNE